MPSAATLNPGYRLPTPRAWPQPAELPLLCVAFDPALSASTLSAALASAPVSGLSATTFAAPTVSSTCYSASIVSTRALICCAQEAKGGQVAWIDADVKHEPRYASMVPLRAVPSEAPLSHHIIPAPALAPAFLPER